MTRFLVRFISHLARVHFYRVVSINQSVLIDFAYFLFIRRSILWKKKLYDIHKLIWLGEFVRLCAKLLFTMAEHANLYAKKPCHWVFYDCMACMRGMCMYKLYFDLINGNWSCLIFISHLWAGCHTLNTIEKLKQTHMRAHSIPCNWVCMYISLPYLKHALEQQSMSQSIILIKWNYNCIKASVWKCDRKMRMRIEYVYDVCIWSDVLSPSIHHRAIEEWTNCVGTINRSL